MPSSILLYPFIIRFNRALTPAATLLFPEVIIPCAPATGLTDVIILSLEVPEMDLFITVSLPWSTPRLLKPMVMSLHEPTRINTSTVEAGRFETLGAVATALSSISRNMHAMECTAFQLVKTGPLFSLLLLDVPDKFVVGAPPDEVRIHRRNIVPDDVVSDDEADLAPNTRCSSGRETLHYIRVDAQVCQNDFFSHVLCEARFYSDAGIKWWAGASVVRRVDEWKAQLYFENEEAAKLAARTLQNAWSNDELFVIIPAPICLDPSFTPSKLLPASSRWRVAFQPAQYFGDGGHTASPPTALHPQASQSAAA